MAYSYCDYVADRLRLASAVCTARARGDEKAQDAAQEELNILSVYEEYTDRFNGAYLNEFDF